MTAKQCNRCKEIKALSAFARKGAGRIQPNCRACTNEYSRGHYRRNKVACGTRVRRRRLVLRRRVAAIRAAGTCISCDEGDPVVLDFDHRPGTKKLGGISELVHRGFRWATIEREIAKCDLVCSNCHRRRTADRRARKAAR